MAQARSRPACRWFDHLGSVDALTDEDGDVIERRSYGPFGQRRNPVWGERPPASFPSKTTQGFTGHESDDELGLVNMKGRMFDPRIGRFLTTDPIISLPFFGQSWNPYSYVLNNPLAYVDPGGFQHAPPEDGAHSPPPPGAEFTSDELGLPPLEIELVLPLPKHGARSGAHTSTVAAETGGAVPPIDVSTTGSASGHVPQPVTTAPVDRSQNPYVQLEGGFVAGLLLGAVPFASVGHGLLDAAGVLTHGTPAARMGLAIGQIVGGIALTIGGLTGEVFGGGITSATGVGAAIGVPAIVVSTGFVVGGSGNIAAGIQGLSQALMSQGSGSQGPLGNAPARRGAGSALRVVNSKMPHAAQRAVERAGFASRKGATEALRAFDQSIETNDLPSGTVRDAAGHLVVPGFGNGGAAVYRLSDGKLTLQTLLSWIEGMGTSLVP
ncbi:RHS repeat domain-containing protein [Sorangium sp. So ce513]|uniref:RHS repeat domain-containing protein n=1 Tax=Sorangium sp. So ce513 TaxID=3133315 RepID=UPI003F608523